MTWTWWAIAGSIMGGLSVILGAFAGHKLESKLDEHSLYVFDIAVRYQMYHSLALFAVSFLASRIDNPYLRFSGVCFTLGTCLFSGSLYLISLGEVKNIGWLTPLGGVLLILAWFSIVLGIVKA